MLEIVLNHAISSATISHYAVNCHIKQYNARPLFSSASVFLLGI